MFIFGSSILHTIFSPHINFLCLFFFFLVVVNMFSDIQPDHIILSISKMLSVNYAHNFSSVQFTQQSRYNIKVKFLTKFIFICLLLLQLMSLVHCVFLLSLLFLFVLDFSFQYLYMYVDVLIEFTLVI